jgi:hypothetical protein
LKQPSTGFFCPSGARSAAATSSSFGGSLRRAERHDEHEHSVTVQLGLAKLREFKGTIHLLLSLHLENILKERIQHLKLE